MPNNSNSPGIFPFGNEVKKIVQKDRLPKPVFVIGINSSAVFARFISWDKSIKIYNIPVENEPDILWNGGVSEARNIVAEIKVPKNFGRVIAEPKILNGILGRVFDKFYLRPLNLNRDQVWICNLLPHFVLSKSDSKAVRMYNKICRKLALPEALLSTKKEKLQSISESRIQEIKKELFESKAEVIITLGQQPINWFIKKYDMMENNLLSVKNYGFIRDVFVDSVKFKLISLFNPRQLLKEKNVDTKIGLLHYDWIKNRSKTIKLF